MRASTPRRRLFTVVLGLLVLAACELLSFAALSTRAGQAVSWGDLERERAAVSGADAADIAAPALPERDFPRRHRDEQAIHPFLGFVMDAGRHPAARRAFDPEAIQHGFPQNVEPLFQQAAPDKVVVAVLGGSVANLLAGQGRDLLSAELARLPRFAGRRIALLNLAAFGYKQPQQLATLSYFLALGAHFDFVINLDGFNDVALPAADLVPRGVFPFFPQSWFARVAGLDPELVARLGELTHRRRSRQERASAFSRCPWRWSFTAGLAWKALDGRLAGRVAEAERALETYDATRLGYAARGPARTYASADDLYRDLAQVWARASWQMHLLCRGEGIEYLHLLQPNQYVEGAKPMGEEERKTAVLADHPYRAAVLGGYPRLREAGAELARRGVAFHDLTRIFAAVEVPLYEDSCCHLNRRGNELLAQAVAGAVAASTGS